MSSRSSLSSVRIINVTKDGHEPGFGSLLKSIESLHPGAFIAIDTEFSGLTKDPDLSNEHIPSRYNAIRRLANSRAIFSIGISVYNPVHSDTKSGPHTYEVATYDFLTCCQDDFAINADAGSFLVAHGFDFKRMFEVGLPYTRASTEKEDDKQKPNGVNHVEQKGDDKSKNASKGKKRQSRQEKANAHLPFRYAKLPRGLIWRMGRKNVPMILHNGLFDLVFLFAAFQAPLAETLDGFIRQLADAAPAGFWDTKILASAAEERASFLGYLFAKAVLSGKVNIENMKSLPAPEYTDPPQSCEVKLGKDTICPLYSFRGFCPNHVSCPFEHDPFIMAAEEEKGTLPKSREEAFKAFKAAKKELKRKQRELLPDVRGLSKKQRKKGLISAGMSAKKDAGVDSPVKVGVYVGEVGAGTAEGARSGQENESKAHTAGWDAFCTGYIFAYFRGQLDEDKFKGERNKIALLSHKLGALSLCKSQFANLDGINTEELQPEARNA
eukprot:GFKZ01012045.1.p1 GENE.GFKZ01012045.1~~GFKZ01012045.1.p1  ORF type:complete len:496 (-),score=70.38 GFKZ01012045.1:135-1622(-)